MLASPRVAPLHALALPPDLVLTLLVALVVVVAFVALRMGKVEREVEEARSRAPLNEAALRHRVRAEVGALQEEVEGEEGREAGVASPPRRA